MDTQDIIDLQPGSFGLIIAPASGVPRSALWTRVARRVRSGPLSVVDGGNCFDFYAIARALRVEALSTQLLNRILIARAFTCYQVLALLSSMPASPMPVLALDLLATFYDENVPLSESTHLLKESLSHLERLSRAAPLLVVVYLRDRPICQERAALLEALQAAAGKVWHLEPPPAVQSQPKLPGF